MVSDAELVERLRDILRSSDLDTTTPSGVRRDLEEYFGVDLSDRKAFIREQIDFFLESHMPNPRYDEGEEEEVGENKQVEAEEQEEEEEEEEEEEGDEDETESSGKRKGK